MKRIICVELSHQNAPLSVREKINLVQMDEMLRDPGIFVLSTCNRLAVYAHSEEVLPVLDFFAGYPELNDFLTIYDEEQSAINHLFRTASGLESQALGEHEILGQIKKAYNSKTDTAFSKSFSAELDEVIRHAIMVGRKVRKETAIGQYPVSLAAISFDIINRHFKDITKAKILIIGTGEMGSLVARILSKKNPARLYIASRSMERAESMAHLYKGKPVLMDDIESILTDMDVVIGATNGQVEMGFSSVKNPVFIDLGLPRNFDPALRNILKERLFDLDDLKAITNEGMQKRQEEIPKANSIIENELQEILFRLKSRQVSPIIKSYFDKLEKIRQEELQWALPRLGELDQKQQQVIEDMLSRLTRRLSGKPIEKLRHYSQEPESQSRPIETFREIFDLDS